MPTLWWNGMVVVRKDSSHNVVEASKKRIINIFSNGLPVYMSFSGGKDSLVLAHLVYSLIQEGKIDAKQLKIHFIDEEGIFPCIEKTVKEWRKKFMLAGAKFDWFCIEVLHFNALNELEADETFVCWDRFKKDKWIRPMPKFARTSHPLLKPRQETYQTFLERIESDGISMIGNRVYESLQRLQNFSKSKQYKRMHPIYDWRDSDVWLYLKENRVKIPDVYMYLWQVGVSRPQLRVSQFFSSDTVKVLVSMNEFYPDLMQRVIRREPNAYIVSLYWDSELFGRSTRKRKNIEKNSDEPTKNYKEELTKLLSDIKGNFNTPHKQKVARSYRSTLLKIDGIATEKHYKRLYEGLLAGDPKLRTLRAVQQIAFSDGRRNIT